ncbi:DUF1659 domain-containing protein [Clostridium intestinale]|uniref:DUF1659 domain-containing protein n=1 Tax=Clostridium intestinale TaxID=36845 RepID=UPI002DD6A1C0|nr:DUF1659 domain-containing protein [Clostridium intestinale]WRY53840.1 DUF1659 domain-containing protein [Clostridium intestinale]
MNVNEDLQTVTLAIEIHNGTKPSGEVTYKKRSFSGIRLDSPTENILNVAKAIASVLNTQTGDYLLTKVSKISETEGE